MDVFVIQLFIEIDYDQLQIDRTFYLTLDDALVNIRNIFYVGFSLPNLMHHVLPFAIVMSS
jgi:hypothetical protein